MALKAAHVACVVLLAIAGSAPGTATAATASTDLPRAEAFPEWLEVMAWSSGEDAGRIYQDYLLAWMVDTYSSADMLVSARGDPLLFKYSPTWPPARPDADNPRIAWKFYATPDEQWPHAAYRLTLPARDAYRVKVHVYCGPEPAGCEEVIHDLERLLAPEVREPAALRAQWETIVRSEACDAAAPASMPEPRYPAAPRLHMRQGTVQVRGMVNRCGQVRTARVDVTSGNRDLDQAAVDAAYRWRLPMTLWKERGEQFGAVVSFVLRDAGDWRNVRTTIDKVWGEASPRP